MANRLKSVTNQLVRVVLKVALSHKDIVDDIIYYCPRSNSFH